MSVENLKMVVSRGRKVFVEEVVGVSPVTEALECVDWRCGVRSEFLPDVLVSQLCRWVGHTAAEEGRVEIPRVQFPQLEWLKRRWQGTGDAQLSVCADNKTFPTTLTLGGAQNGKEAGEVVTMIEFVEENPILMTGLPNEWYLACDGILVS